MIFGPLAAFGHRMPGRDGRVPTVPPRAYRACKLDGPHGASLVEFHEGGRPATTVVLLVAGGCRIPRFRRWTRRPAMSLGDRFPALSLGRASTDLDL